MHFKICYIGFKKINTKPRAKCDNYSTDQIIALSFVMETPPVFHSKSNESRAPCDTSAFCLMVWSLVNLTL